MTELERKNTYVNSREHLANERTFLAWIRTSIALMGFGFVIVKFSLFLKEIALLLESTEDALKGYSAMVGVIMIALGVIIALLAFIKYNRNNKQIANNVFYSSTNLSLFITVIILIGGTLLIAYLLTIV